MLIDGERVRALMLLFRDIFSDPVVLGDNPHPRRKNERIRQTTIAIPDSDRFIHPPRKVKLS
jgi:hypothetical protein